MKWLLYILLIAMGICIGITIPRKGQSERYETFITDTLRDTIRDSIPYPSSIVSLPPRAYFFDKIDTLKGDTIHDTLLIPIVQKEYKTDKYRLLISGYQPSLDSIDIYQNTIIQKVPIKPKKWHVGIQGGYGMTPKGFTSYVGFGISYSLY